MSCQCYQIGGPFIAEDPDCLVHGSAGLDRARQADSLLNEAQQISDVVRLREIIDQLHTLAVDL